LFKNEMIITGCGGWWWKVQVVKQEVVVGLVKIEILVYQVKVHFTKQLVNILETVRNKMKVKRCERCY
jgi:hypothetical protein